ncbi:ATP-binding protein [Rhizobium leguminosarum]|uniref:ATP-binding protein n=1 Tax=Rhizobium leguminosarum TaxID=384 RepID=UPI001C95E8DA|nr:ATP-binding protein [Rhizobium leguminosarum]MBY5404617.1 ATP-binding protein [Rhizobium leguminosarum]
MVKLSFVESYLSITEFPAIDLPDFTLITGPNGAGKSHLLHAIQRGKISTDAAPGQLVDSSQIRLFDWTNMFPSDPGAFDSNNSRRERLHLYEQYLGQKNSSGRLDAVRSVVVEVGLRQFIIDPGEVLTVPIEDLVKIIGDYSHALLARGKVKAALDQFDAILYTVIDAVSADHLRAIVEHTQLPLVSLTEIEILSTSIPTWGQIDLFQQNFGRLFVSYRDTLLVNNIGQFRAQRGDDVNFLSDDEFTERYGRPPWDFVNSAIQSAGLDFEINAPYLYDYTAFQPTLKKRSTGATIPFHSLSSGEKVLMSLAFCVYYSIDRRQLATRPRILLLDEIDAPLHPSMSRSILDTIMNTLIGEFGIKVIATTHSPSTVALAHEGSIFTMRPDAPGLRKSSKATALNILTVGVPTIAISYDGRRQVFVESPTDAKIYDALYKLIKSKIVSERSLEFIATGRRNSGGGDFNTGCDNVIRVVSALADAGNTSVFGLLDWDGTNQPDHRISVIAYGKRNGIENVLFDPLLVALAIARSNPSELHQIGLQNGTGFIEVAGSNATTLQTMVNKVGNVVFGEPAQSHIDSRYLGGLSLSIDSRFGGTDDHELEGRILIAFPFLRSISKGQAGKFLDYMVSVVLTDTKFVPADIVDVFKELLERPSHQ